VGEDRGSSGRIKVVDKRSFTEDGDLRPDRPRPKPEAKPPDAAAPKVKEPAPPAETRPPAASAPAGPPAQADDGPTGATSQMFVELVATLAQQAELLMTGGGGLPKQPEQAQRLIDYLGVLESKTRGNLSAEESQVLGSVLFELRTLFVQSRK